MKGRIEVLIKALEDSKKIKIQEISIIDEEIKRLVVNEP
jgi:hypothetical protein